MFRKLLNITHWSQKTRDATLHRDEAGLLHVRLLGGAEYGQLIYLGACPGAAVSRGRLHPGDLLLEVNQAPVPGLTLRDASELLGAIPGPVHLRTVPQGSQLNSDLRHFLKHTFTQGSADFELQECIRQNLYIRAVPCTTRAPREGERPGVDFHFVSLSEFQALERAGGLLETGKFDGNYYGTPVPPILPTDATLTLEPSMLRARARSKSLPSGAETRSAKEAAEGDPAGGRPQVPGAASNGYVTGSTSDQDVTAAGGEGTEHDGVTGQPGEQGHANAASRESRPTGNVPTRASIPR
ncbi:membrane-associated guanylate kinase, WW and PDZ domain-containing protein 2-like [Hemiscyllium ocellatum]|uniref:membrane-associated guanylate kinase, WW and PDZ domain-containing protein 2-like n=1 Tax=Hemiscyllium ocellatum TaxID=170820 RepID=UPI002966AA88|nr:membrane-associated guanylate kinase, WW and PDZ domain-containing protein 2-like [Hemiscyllium ocellatum]